MLTGMFQKTYKEKQFIFLARMISTSQMMSSFLKRQNSNAPMIRT